MAQKLGRQDPGTPSIQEMCPHCARMQTLMLQVAEVADNYRRMVEEMSAELAPEAPPVPRAA